MPYTTTARELFDSVLPGFVAGASVDIAGPVLFEIEGRDGGTWVVDFGARTVSAGPSASPVKAIVRAADGDFMALVEGRMSPDDGLLTKRLHLAGDAASLAHLMDAFEQLRAAAP
jgi:putative sterol carrier protein